MPLESVGEPLEGSHHARVDARWSCSARRRRRRACAPAGAVQRREIDDVASRPGRGAGGSTEPPQRSDAEGDGEPQPSSGTTAGVVGTARAEPTGVSAVEGRRPARAARPRRPARDLHRHAAAEAPPDDVGTRAWRGRRVVEQRPRPSSTSAARTAAVAGAVPAVASRYAVRPGRRRASRLAARADVLAVAAEADQRSGPTPGAVQPRRVAAPRTGGARRCPRRAAPPRRRGSRRRRVTGESRASRCTSEHRGRCRRVPARATPCEPVRARGGRATARFGRP